MTSQTPRSPTGPLTSPRMLAVAASVLNAPTLVAIWWAYLTAAAADGWLVVVPVLTTAGTVAFVWFVFKEAKG